MSTTKAYVPSEHNQNNHCNQSMHHTHTYVHNLAQVTQFPRCLSFVTLLLPLSNIRVKIRLPPRTRRSITMGSSSSKLRAEKDMEKMDQRIGVLTKQRRYAEATEVGRQLLEKSRSARGPEHPDTLSIMYYFGAVLHADGKFEDAEQNFRQLLPLREKVLGPDHRDTIAALDALCESLCNLRKYEESMEIFDKELQRCERAFGPEHELTIKTLRNMGNVYRMQGDPHLASSVLLRALELSERLFGPEHSTTSGIRGDLSEVRGPPDSLALRQALAAEHGLPIPGDPLAGIKTMSVSQLLGMDQSVSGCVSGDPEVTNTAAIRLSEVIGCPPRPAVAIPSYYNNEAM
jgi:tetratricopeptide (TPR) repeat protein